MPTVTFKVRDGVGAPSGTRKLLFRARHMRKVGDAIIATKGGPTSELEVTDGELVTIDLAEGPMQVSGLDYYGVGTIDFTVPPEGGDLWNMIALEIGLPKPSNTEQVRAAVQAWLDDNAPDDLLSKADADNTYAPQPAGTPNGAKFLRDDNTWATPPSGGGAGEDAVSAEQVNIALSTRTLAPVVEVPESTDEWWVWPIATQLSWPYPRIVKASYGEGGEMLVSESVPGVPTKVVVAWTPPWAIDDHNAPWLFAENGHRLVMGSSHHGEYKYLQMVVSDRAGTIESLATAPVLNFDMTEYTFTHTNYGQCHRVEHLSTVDAFGAPLLDYFWLFVRAGDKWDIVEFTVHQGTGAVTIVNRRPFLQGQTLQWYCTTVSAHDPSGQKIRVAAYANPSSWQHAIWYCEIDVETGIVTSPLASGLNHDLASGVLVAFNSTTGPGFTPLLTQPASGISRRLLAVRPGPAQPAVLWADWNTAAPNDAVYHLTSYNGSTWTTVDLGNAGPRFGYVEGSNYLAGGCFPDPCVSDELYLARNTSPTKTLERSYINRAGTRVFETLATSTTKALIRPNLAKGGSAAKVMFSEISAYSTTGFSFTGRSRSIAENAGITDLAAVQALPDTTDPTVPGSPAAVAILGGAEVTFTPATDDVGVTGYRVYRSTDSYASAVATGAGSPIAVTGLATTPVAFKVTAVDAAGNESAQSAATSTVTPLSQDEILPTAGALLLIDPTNPHQAWPSGVPTSTVPNLARAQAQAAAGVGELADFDLVVSNTLTPTDGAISRTSKGALYSLISQSTDVQNRAFRLSSERLRAYFAANPGHAYFMSAWLVPVRRSTASPPLYYTRWVGPRGNGTTDLMAIGEVTGLKVSAAPSTNRTNVVESATPAPLGTPVRAGGAWSSIGTVHASDATMVLMGITNNAAHVHSGSSYILYRAYIEDLTESGRGHNTIAALDQSLFNAAFDPGGRYNGDTYPAASTLP